MISFLEWAKKKAIKNKDIDRFLQSVDALERDLEELDRLEKKSKQRSLIVKKDDKEPLDEKEPLDSVDSDVDDDRDDQLIRQPSDTEIPTISSRSRTKSNRLPDSEI
jgi:hypothetical protein